MKGVGLDFLSVPSFGGGWVGDMRCCDLFAQCSFGGEGRVRANHLCMVYGFVVGCLFIVCWGGVRLVYACI